MHKDVELHGLETEAPEIWIPAVNHDREKIVYFCRFR
jgi:hypothetical protein